MNILNFFKKGENPHNSESFPVNSNDEDYEVDYKEPSTERVISTKKNKILLFDLTRKSIRSLSLEEAISFKDSPNHQNFVMVFQALDNEKVVQIRKAYNLHPVIDQECSSSYFTFKNHLLRFHQHLLVTMTDADFEATSGKMVSIRMIFFEDLLMIFSSDTLYCIKKVFWDELDFVDECKVDDWGEATSPEEIFPQINLTRKHTHIEIGLEQGCTEVEAIFVKLLEVMFERFEQMVLRMDSEARICFEYSRGLTYKERSDFILRLSLSEKNMIFLRDLIKPKKHLVKKLKKSSLISRELKVYLKSMKSRCFALYEKLNYASELMKTAEKIYEATVDDTMTNSTNRLNEIFLHFSAIATIFLPLHWISGLWGMNIMVPMQDQDGYWPFALIVVTSLSVVASLSFWMRKKNLI